MFGWSPRTHDNSEEFIVLSRSSFSLSLRVPWECFFNCWGSGEIAGALLFDFSRSLFLTCVATLRVVLLCQPIALHSMCKILLSLRSLSLRWFFSSLSSLMPNSFLILSRLVALLARLFLLDCFLINLWVLCGELIQMLTEFTFASRHTITTRSCRATCCSNEESQNHGPDQPVNGC